MIHTTSERSSRTWLIVSVGLVVNLVSVMALASVAGAAPKHKTPGSKAGVTVTLGSGLSNVAGQDLNTSFCVEPEVGSSPITLINSDPAPGSYTCAVSPPVHPYIVTPPDHDETYWGSSTGAGPLPVAGAGTQWVGESTSGLSLGGVETYIYDATVDVPCLPTKKLTKKNTPKLTGKMAADNAAYAYLNGNQIGTMPVGYTTGTDPVTNFEKAHAVGPAAPSDWHAGTNTVDFVVHDDGDVTGIDYALSIKIPAADECSVGVTLGSGLSNVSGQDLNTSLCVEPEVGGSPITYPSDPSPGSDTCGVSPPVNPYIVTPTSANPDYGYVKYWGSPSGTGPTPVAGAGTSWVGESTSGVSISDPSSGTPVDTYIYDATVNVPCLESTAPSPTLTGAVAADNAVYAYLNGNPIGNDTYPTDPVSNFESTTAVNAAALSDWIPGTNTVDFVVHDDDPGYVTGIDYSLSITIPGADESCGVPSSGGTSVGPATCTGLSGTVAFPSPGLSQKGSTSTAKTSTSTVTGTAIGNCTASSEAFTDNSGPGSFSVTSENTKLRTKPVTYSYDTVSQFAATGAAELQKAIPTLHFTVGGYDVLFTTKSVAEVAGSPCGASEVGFMVNGAVTAAPFGTTTATVTICLEGDTGPGTTGNFASDLDNPAATIATATIDPATSTAVL